MDIPILLIVFNRPKETRELINILREIKPKKIYVSADGPKFDNRFNKEISETREVINEIDWDCTLLKRFNKENLGCRVAVSLAIDWLFENEEYGIILEDDCMPSVSFFQFCQENLLRYRNNRNISIISGRNHLKDYCPINNSDYFFSTGSIWGWATWKDSWKMYSKAEEIWKDCSKVKNSLLWFKELSPKKYRQIIDGCQKEKLGKISSWAYIWSYARILNKTMGIIPRVNLVKNIGFSSSATHTSNYEEDISSSELQFPLNHPKVVRFDKIDFSYSDRTAETRIQFFFSKRILRRFRKILFKYE